MGGRSCITEVGRHSAELSLSLETLKRDRWAHHIEMPGEMLAFKQRCTDGPSWLVFQAACAVMGDNDVMEHTSCQQLTALGEPSVGKKGPQWRSAERTH